MDWVDFTEVYVDSNDEEFVRKISLNRWEIFGFNENFNGNTNILLKIGWQVEVLEDYESVKLMLLSSDLVHQAKQEIYKR